MDENCSTQFVRHRRLRDEEITKGAPKFYKLPGVDFLARQLGVNESTMILSRA